MALVTVQRSPSPSASAETDEVDAGLDAEDGTLKSPRNRSFSESYFTVKGAALILPQSDYEAAYNRKATKGHGGDIQSHLQSMFSLLRPLDTIKVAVKLEGSHDRYLALVSCLGKQDTEESVILGMDLKENTAAIGLIMPVWAHTHIQLDGDGGFSITSNKETRFFKPVSVQAMWSALQSLNKVAKIANDNLYIPGGLTHTWIGFYDAKRSKENQIVSEWITTSDIDRSYRTDSSVDTTDEDSIYKRIKTELKLVMMSVDLEEVTCKFLRESIEATLGMNLREYRHFIDTEMFEILGQMDAPSKIQDYLYLGSEWNASNIEELQNNGVHYILNVSREIDNFFPGILSYMNVREWDIETADLLKHWEDTHKYINRARKKNGKVLVHCKMGISRSASTVIAYLMKELKWSRDEAFDFTKQKRSIINPNSGFWKQLETYEGILTARRNWENFDKPVVGGLIPPQESEENLNLESMFPSNAEDLIAMKLGKDASDFGNSPFVHTEPDIELSSRSADSTEESLPDERSPQPTDGSETGATGGAFLYPRGKKAKSSSGDYLETDSSDNTNSEEMSDSDLDEKNSFRPIDVPAIDIQDSARRKHGQKTDMRKADPRRSKSESDKSTLTVDNKISGFSREGSVSKFRPDESWIKLAQSDEEEQTAEPMDTGQGQESKTDDDGLWMVDRKQISEKTEIVDDAQGSVEQVKVKEKTKDSVETENMETELSMDLNKASVVIDPSVDRSNVESGIQEQCAKESIPWNPGIVKKQKQDSVKESEAGSVSVDQEVMAESQKDTPHTEANDCGVVINVEKEMEVDQSDDAKTDISEASTTEKTKMRSRPSVYDLEEIELPEDFVKKTRQEIEDRLTVDTPRRKLQRSSSLKSKRVTPKAKDRDNERRKTCIAMLSPTNSDFSLIDQTELGKGEITDMKPSPDQLDVDDFSVVPSADTETESEEKMDETGTVKVYKFMGEELTVQEGLVRKQTLDIEQKALEVKRLSTKQDSEMEQSGMMSESASVSSISSSDFLSQPKETEYPSTKVLPSSTVSKDDSQNASDKVNKNYPKDIGPKQEVNTSSVKGDSGTENIPGKDSSVSPSSLNVSKGTTEAETESKVSKDVSEIVKEKDAAATAAGLVHAKRIDSIKANFQEMGKSTQDEKMETDSVGITAAPAAFRKRGIRKQESRFDEETLELIREIGSALMNSPAKTEVEEETDAPLEGGNLVSHYVKNIERRIRGSRKKKSVREIIIVDKDSGQDSASVSGSQRSSTSTPTSSCDNRTESSIPHNPKWSPTSRKPLSPSSITSSPETVQTFKGSPVEKHESMHKPDPLNLSLNLKLDASPKAEQSVDKDAESETCSVKNLVGKFETSSGSTTPVSMLFGCIGSPSSNCPMLPGATEDIEVIEKKDTFSGEPVASPKAETSKNVHDMLTGHCFSPKLPKSRNLHDTLSSSAFSRPSGRVLQRQSEPDIHLSERNIQLLDAKLRESGAGLIPSACIIESEEEDTDSVHDSSVPSFMTRSRSEDQGQGRREHRSRFVGAKSKTGSLGRSQTFSECDTQETPMFTWEGKKIRKNYGKSHPLAKLEGTYRGSIRSTPFYSTM